MTDEDVLRPDPGDDDAAFERQENREIPVTNARPPYKEDYKRTSRQGRKVYVAGSVTLDADDWKALPSKKQTARKEPARAAFSEESAVRTGRTSHVLSQKEAQELYEPLREAIKSEFHVIDEALWLRCPQIDGRDIWGNVDDDETEALASLLLKRGQRNAATAAVVRGMIDASDYIVVGAMFVPRIQQTVMALRETPKRGRPLVSITPFRRKKVEA